MVEKFAGQVEITGGTSDAARILLDGVRGDVRAGGNGENGNLVLSTDADVETIRLNGGVGDMLVGGEGAAGNVYVRDGSGARTIALNGGLGDVVAGGNGADGNLVLKSNDGVEGIRLNGGVGDMLVGGEGAAGNVYVRDGSGERTIALNGGLGDVVAGGNGADGNLVLKSNDGEEGIRLNGGVGDVLVGKDDAIRLIGRHAQVFVGATDNEGDVVIYDSTGTESIKMDGGSASISVGATHNVGGYVGVKNSWGTDMVAIEGESGKVSIKNVSGVNIIQLVGSNAQLLVGAAGSAGQVIVLDDQGNPAITLDGVLGDVELGGGDIAEQFATDGGQELSPGSVVALVDEHTVTTAIEPYDSAVIGVVAGAGPYKPGVVLDVKDDPDRVPVALMGKVMCWVDATDDEVRMGDLLTTSAVSGHAMKAADPQRAFGSVVGKALRGLASGRGLIPVLLGAR